MVRLLQNIACGWTYHRIKILHLSKTNFDINKFGYNIVVKMNVNVQN